ncbi:hypothetical protein, partial [Limnobacter litoralis]|uniref:hypothetical protein n=1 Tax=Limnobacter litoralis TaxID=481366 RepID=UPI0024E0F89E
FSLNQSIKTLQLTSPSFRGKVIDVLIDHLAVIIKSLFSPFADEAVGYHKSSGGYLALTSLGEMQRS